MKVVISPFCTVEFVGTTYIEPSPTAIPWWTDMNLHPVENPLPNTAKIANDISVGKKFISSLKAGDTVRYVLTRGTICSGELIKVSDKYVHVNAIADGEIKKRVKRLVPFDKIILSV